METANKKRPTQADGLRPGQFKDDGIHIGLANCRTSDLSRLTEIDGRDVAAILSASLSATEIIFVATDSCALHSSDSFSSGESGNIVR